MHDSLKALNKIDKVIVWAAGTLWACRYEQDVLPALPASAGKQLRASQESFFMNIDAEAGANKLWI